MAEIIMPKMGDAMTEGKVVRWYKKQGDTVKKGEPLLEIETDKVNLDLEAEEDGPLGEILVQEGSMVDVGTVLAVIGGEAPAKGAKKKPAPEEKEKAEPAEDAPQQEEEGEPQEPAPDEKAPKKKETEPRAEQPPQDDAKKQPAPAPEAKPVKSAGKEETAAPAGDGKHVRSSPLARKMAGELGVDIASLSGSGPSGRVVAADVKKAAEGGGKPAAGKVAEASASDSRAPREKSALPEYRKLKDETIPLTAMRRTIAKRLAESIGPIPHFFPHHRGRRHRAPEGERAAFRNLRSEAEHQRFRSASDGARHPPSSHRERELHLRGNRAARKRSRRNRGGDAGGAHHPGDP
jgi:pyruvate dehydrogenase E2 component (dihydrolipoamide acetyltransferase)